MRSFAELDREHVGLVAEAWRARAEAGRAGGLGYLHALVNEGRAAGASLPHSHSQLVWLGEEPPSLRGERAERLAELLARDDLRVAADAGVAAICHPAGRAPYEVLIAAREPSGDPWEPGAGLDEALALLAEVVRRLRAVEGPVPWNAWLHAGPRWHVELVPRLSVFAGVELGAGIYVNPVAPEDAAAALRAAAP